MPPKKKAAAAAPRKLPPPNLSHPCSSLLPAALDRSTLPHRPHPASYHCFLSSPFYPSSSRALSSSDEPPAKRKKKDEPALPPLLEDAAIEASVVQRKLLAWFDEIKEKRGMPWRKEVRLEEMTKEEKSQRAYEVWVSEIMLQQTQVATVIPYWTRWMEAFPTVEDLAKADPEEVNAVWKGLGYYSRAKRLLEGAKTVVDKHDGLIPSTVDGLLQVDGIGPYTAGAVSSIAFARRSPLVDGNVQRVFSRLTAFHAPPAAKATTNFIWALADVLVPAQPKKSGKAQKEEEEVQKVDPTTSPHFKRKKADDLADVGGPNKPGAWNQALMELGATVCTPKNPKCEECPVSEECLGYTEARYYANPPSRSSSSASPSPPDIEDLCTLCSPLPDNEDDASSALSHSVEAYPMAKEKTKKRDEETAVCVLEWVNEGGDRGGEEGRKVLLIKRPEKGLLAGLYEFPAVDLPTSSPSTAKSRSKALNALLPTLLDNTGLSSALSSADEDDGEITVVSRTTLPPVEHIYSHMKRTYFGERIVLSSASLPTLHTSSSSSSSSSKKSSQAGDVVQSLPGRGKWVDAADVEGANTGGAVGKVWEERERVAKGLGPAKEKKGKKAGAGGGTKAKGKGKEEKGQGSLVGFFMKKETVAKEKGGSGKGKKRAENSDDDMVIVEDEVKVAAVREEKENKVEVKVEEKKVYKKRRIAPASDEEDE
ncbi:hypothetical protein JCM6882_001019 [Rhodosporidiobolus microsporus]